MKSCGWFPLFFPLFQMYRTKRTSVPVQGKSPILNQFYMDLAYLFLHLVSQKKISGLKMWFYIFLFISIWMLALIW